MPVRRSGRDQQPVALGHMVGSSLFDFRACHPMISAFLHTNNLAAGHYGNGAVDAVENIDRSRMKFPDRRRNGRLIRARAIAAGESQFRS